MDKEKVDVRLQCHPTFVASFIKSRKKQQRENAKIIAASRLRKSRALEDKRADLLSKIEAQNVKIDTMKELIGDLPIFHGECFEKMNCSFTYYGSCRHVKH